MYSKPHIPEVKISFIETSKMKYKLLSLYGSFSKQACRAVHMSTSQQKAKTRAMLDRMIRCERVGLNKQRAHRYTKWSIFFYKKKFELILFGLELTMLESTELTVSMRASWPS